MRKENTTVAYLPICVLKVVREIEKKKKKYGSGESANFLAKAFYFHPCLTSGASVLKFWRS